MEVDDLEDDALSGREHDRLLSDIRTLNKKQKDVTNKKVLKLDNLADSVLSEKIQLHEVLDPLQTSSVLPALRKQIKKLKSKTLKAPPTKPAQEKIERSVVYQKVSKELKVWDPLVTKNRKAPQLNFPLLQPDLRLITAGEKAKQAKPMTALEKQVYDLLQGSKFNIPEDQLMSPDEERQLLAMTVEEAKLRRAELKRHRALVSHKVAEHTRKNKIKSKRYHKMLRHKDLKQEKKRLDHMQQSDPQAFQEELEKMDRKRIEERASLRHRGGSKKLKQKALFGKYNAETRQAIQDMIQKNKQLTQKIQTHDSDSDELEVESDQEDGVMEEVMEEEEEMVGPEELQQVAAGNPVVAVAESSNTHTKQRWVVEETETTEKLESRPEKKRKKSNSTKKKITEPDEQGDELDPHKFLHINAPEASGTMRPVQVQGNDDEYDDEDDDTAAMNIEEAFADDDVIEQFEMNKEALTERDRVKDIDLTLPGWGSWAGAGIDPAKTRRSGVIIKAPVNQPRQDDKLKHVILSQAKDESIRKHQVSTIPFPFDDVSRFEKVIREPIGKLWNPETIYRKKIEPKITTKIGTIIDPVDKTQLLKSKARGLEPNAR